MSFNSFWSNDSFASRNISACLTSVKVVSFGFVFVSSILPLCLLVFYLGLRQRRSSSATAMRHSDAFTFHVVSMELIAVFGWIAFICGVYTSTNAMVIVSSYSMSFQMLGEMCFQNLTCLEHYLAVVHPITYLSLKRQRGIRIRNITIACVWLFCFMGTYVVKLITLTFVVCCSSLSLISVTFFSLSVLHVLIRPGPGEEGGDRDRIHRTKQRALGTIVAILAVLLSKFTWHLISSTLIMGQRYICEVIATEFWLTFPSTLLLPVLFLLRSGEAVCCRKNK